MSNDKNKSKTATATTAIATNFNAATRMTMVQSELAKLQKIAETAYNTADKNILGISIQNETSIEKLLSLDASVKGQQKAYDSSMADKVAKGFIPGAKPFEISGVSADGIIKDIDLRLQVLATDERRNKLSSIMAGYKELVSRDEKIQMLDQELQAFLGTQA